MTATGTAQLWGRLRVVCASANPDKVAEIKAILGDAVELVPRPDRRARRGRGRRHADRQRPAEGRRPRRGDRSAGGGRRHRAGGRRPRRCSGGRTPRASPARAATYADNRSKLLIELDGVPLAERRRAFKTVVAAALARRSRARRRGRLPRATSPRRSGVSGASATTPCSCPTSDGRPASRTFAEMTEDEKHAISHRGRAFRALLAALDETHR